MLYMQALLLVAMVLHLLWDKSCRCWIFINMAGNMWGGILHFLAKTNTSIIWVITIQCTTRPCLSEVASHGPSTCPVELLILVAHELLSRHYHAGVLGLLLLLRLLLLLLLLHHGMLRRHAIPHVRLLVPTRLLLNLPARTNIYALYTYR